VTGQADRQDGVAVIRASFCGLTWPSSPTSKIRSLREVLQVVIRTVRCRTLLAPGGA
jgi:hypothetical protein